MVRQQRGEVAFYTFTCLSGFDRLVHAVFTRHGGVSTAPYATLNVSRSVGDRPEAVADNHRRLADAIGINRTAIATAYQVGGCRVARVGPDGTGTVARNTDALITDTPGIPLLLRFADCLPIVVYDPVRCAVGLAHAGWRGTLAGVARQTVRAMVEAFGCRPADLVVAVGPGIGPCCYQVGPEVVAAVRTAFADAEPLLSVQPDGSYHFDLWAANVRQLVEAGVGQVDVAGLCTACHVGEFFSHRGEHGRTGRFAGIVMLDGERRIVSPGRDESGGSQAADRGGGAAGGPRPDRGHVGRRDQDRAA
jgi:YfiH family protein